MPPLKVAGNLTWLFFETLHKRCNPNDVISKPEILAVELHAKLLRFVAVVARAPVTAYVNPIGGGLGPTGGCLGPPMRTLTR